MANFAQRIRSVFEQKASVEPTEATTDAQGQMKAFVSNDFLYKPPYGYPRNEDIPTARMLAATPYVYMVVSTIIDEVACVDWDIVPKEDDEPDGVQDTSDDTTRTSQAPRKNAPALEHIKEVKSFFYKPNNNYESFEFLVRAAARDILELDSGVWVKVFNRGGKFSQLFARDGGTFLKNPDIHGYMGDREDIITMPEFQNEKERKDYYGAFLTKEAAYFQYGWVAMMPIPFGKREIVYMMRNPRADSIYGRSAVLILQEVLQTLIYGSRFNWDYYTNNNMPDGVIQLIGADKSQIDAFRARFEQQFKQKDEYGVWRKIFHKFPIASQEVKFTPFMLKPAEMEIIQQQEWFCKLVWACFGVTPSELGFTADSNKSTELVQSEIFKRKAVKPILKLIEHAINTQIIPEFGYDDIEFRFVEYNLNEDVEKHKLYEIQLNNGIRSVNEVRQDMGLESIPEGDVYNIKKPMDQMGMDGQQTPAQKLLTAQGKIPDNNKGQEGLPKPDPNKKQEEKSIPAPEAKEELEDTLESYMAKRQELILSELEKIYTSDKLSEIKGFDTLWERLTKQLKGLFTAAEIKPIVDNFVKSFYVKGMENSELEFSQNFFPNDRAIQFLQEYNFDLVKNMTDDIANQLRTTLQRAYMNNTPFSQIKDEVKDIFNKNETRAASIVRTEQNRAENYGRIEGAQQSRIVKGKSILNYLDEKTSPLCKRMMRKYGEKTIGLNDKFVDSETGESWMAPPFHVNCRTRLITPRKED